MDHGCGAVVDVELPVYMFEVSLDSGRADREAFGDRLDRETLAGEREDLDLALRQRGGRVRAIVLDHAQLVLGPVGRCKYDDVPPRKDVGEGAIENVEGA